jgi:dihydroorotase
LSGTRKLDCELTVKNGLVVYDLNGISREDWKKLGSRYRGQGDKSWDGTR